MQVTLSHQMIESINELVHSQSMCEILDIYQAAANLQQLHPRDNVALEDIMNEILVRVKPGTAVSFIRTESPAGANPYAAIMEPVNECDIDPPSNYSHYSNRFAS